MSGILLPGDLGKELAELRARQRVKRTAGALGVWEVGELSALQKLAHDLFQDRGVIEFRPDEPGIAHVGRAHKRQRRGRPEAYRYREADWLFSGASIAEISKQVAVWRAHR